MNEREEEKQQRKYSLFDGSHLHLWKETDTPCFQRNQSNTLYFYKPTQSTLQAQRGETLGLPLRPGEATVKGSMLRVIMHKREEGGVGWEESFTWAGIVTTSGNPGCVCSLGAVCVNELIDRRTTRDQWTVWSLLYLQHTEIIIRRVTVSNEVKSKPWLASDANRL